MKRIILLSALLFSFFISHAQNSEFGSFTQEEMDMKKYSKDTSAHAVFLNEYGRLELNEASDEYLKYVEHYHARIKIFDKQAFDYATIELLVHADKDVDDEVTDIKGITTYRDDEGNIKQAELNASQVFKVKENKYWNKVKFTMPNVRNGCIIDFSYTIFSTYWQQLPIWYFQTGIPKMYSEYELHLPAYWRYNASMRGSLKLDKNFAEVERSCFTLHGGSVDCSHLDFAMKDIPAFIEEADMTASNNFKSAVYFELAQFTNPYDYTKHNYSRQWSDVDYELKHSSSFGIQLKRKDLMKDRITPLIAGINDSLTKAKAIYAYIKKSIKFNEFYGIGTDDGIRKALDSHSGSVADINFALTTALSAAGFDASVVLLSTRDHGMVNKLYPTIEEFDYVICTVDIGGKNYLLDATDPLLSFGMLPIRCLNDEGRVMCLDKPSYWIDLTKTGQRETNTYNYDLTLQPDGKIKGTITHYSSGYAAYQRRRLIKQYNSVDEYVESLDAKSTRFKILNSEVTNVDSLDNTICEKYDIEIKEYDNTNNARLAFNPFILDQISVNPYKLAERNYPVDIGMPNSDRYTLVLHLPKDYSIETPPQDIGIALPNNGGKFVTNFQADSNSFTFSHIWQLNKSIYSPEEYPYLKELYNKIILTQKGEMILKRKI